jgi:hypothetical protein
LPRAVLGRIVKDEAAHGTFGFAFLDWALPSLSSADKKVLGGAADRGIRAVHKLWDGLKRQRNSLYTESGDALAWMHSDAYLALAERSLETQVRAPLRKRGIPFTL